MLDNIHGQSATKASCFCCVTSVVEKWNAISWNCFYLVIFRLFWHITGTNGKRNASLSKTKQQMVYNKWTISGRSGASDLTPTDPTYWLTAQREFRWVWSIILAPTDVRTESHLFFAVPERDQGQCCCWLPVGHQGGKFNSVHGIP